MALPLPPFTEALANPRRPPFSGNRRRGQKSTGVREANLTGPSACSDRSSTFHKRPSCMRAGLSLQKKCLNSAEGKHTELNPPRVCVHENTDSPSFISPPHPLLLDVLILTKTNAASLFKQRQIQHSYACRPHIYTQTLACSLCLHG